MMHRMTKVFDVGEKLINGIISVLLMLMTIVIFYQVVLRYAFQAANIWAEEFARYAFIWVVLLGSASAMRNSKHIKIDFLVDGFSDRSKWVLNNFVCLAMGSFLFCLAVYGFKIALKTGNQLSAGLHVPMSFMYMSIPVGAVLMLLALVERLLEINVKSPSTGLAE
ncbi:TRAP transporter small permease [Aminithiophilus ramosus]|uniref:TRAP transporter small permease n=2 Tax=Aminithiophilus ramosus TaxID=3029084 RepID=A0A9Q7ADE2_9BACT|nr:TRAP transporter small permease [Aminithiophilus ramosus]